MIKRITPYRWFAALLLSLGLFTVGCGSSGDEFVAQGGGQNTPVGTIVVNQVLLRAVPSAVTQQRFTGFDSSGVVRFGPVTLAKAASIELTGVSTSVTRLQIEYLQGNTVVGLGSVAVTVTANGTTTVDDPPFQDVTAGLNSIEVTPAAPTIAAGTQQAFTAMGNFADGTEVDLTSSVTWTSSSLANATINDNGVATGVAVGSSTITASVGSVSGTATLTISGATLVSLEITPANPPLAQGGTQQLTLTGTFSDDSTQNLAAMATWTSGNPDIATVSDTAPSKGLVTANNISSGTASVQASVLGQSASTTISVTGPTLALLQVYSNSANVPAGFSAQLTAIATYTDQTTATVTE